VRSDRHLTERAAFFEDFSPRAPHFTPEEARKTSAEALPSIPDLSTLLSGALGQDSGGPKQHLLASFSKHTLGPCESKLLGYGNGATLASETESELRPLDSSERRLFMNSMQACQGCLHKVEVGGRKPQPGTRFGRGLRQSGGRVSPLTPRAHSSPRWRLQVSEWLQCGPARHRPACTAPGWAGTGIG